MKKRRTEEDGDPSSIKPLSKLKKQRLNASEGEKESKAINPEPKAEKDNKIAKKKKKKEKVKIVERGMEEEKSSYLPGQRHDTPHERDPFRIFLETLHQRIPENELVASWMIEWGLLSSGEGKVCDKMLDKNLHEELESAKSDVADARTSTLSGGNLDVVSGTVSKAKKQKVRKTSSDDATSGLNSRKKGKNKTN